MAHSSMFDPASAFPSHAIAIVGLAGRFPGAQNFDDFWRNIWAGVELLKTFSDEDLDAAGVDRTTRSNPLFVRKGTVLETAELFDADFFGLSPREAQILDPQHRVFLECAWEALEHAGYAPGMLGKTVGVYGGASMNTYLLAHILRDKALIDAVGGYQLMLGNDKDFLCTRVSYKLDLHGPSMTIQTACSTSLVAVEVACRALQSGECDIALAGGVSLSFPQQAGYLYQEGMILSPDGHCRPFDSAGGGIRPGAGAGIVVLKRLGDALADRDTIQAVIIGAAVNNDGAGKVGYTAPSIDGQVEAIATAQALAGVDPRSITYIEAHGTATPLGDPIEIAALTQVFRASTSDVGFCRLGALKANLGHLDAAAGVAGLIKTVLALKHRQIPPLVNFRSPNPQLDLEHSPFIACSEGSAWPNGSWPRRAGVSSFGIGGTNAHVVIEEAPPAIPETTEPSDQLIVLSAKTASALDQATANLAEHLDRHPDVSLRDVAWTLQVGRKPFAHRRALVVPDVAQAVTLLEQPRPMSVFNAVNEGGARPVAFLFSGQGSQHAGMGADLYRTEPRYRDAIDRCAALLQPHLGTDIRDIIFAGDANGLLNETRFTQPALFCIEYALAALWMRLGVSPGAMLGHSIGEYVAAHLAGVFSLADALAVVAARGHLMQELPSGAMAAVHLSATELAPWLTAGVVVAAENAPNLCTISGGAGPVAEILRRLEAKGIECRPLHTSHAFHSPMMEPALAPFVAVLEGISLSAPTIPYISNVTGDWITAAQATSPQYYATHLRQTVRFETGIRTLAADPTLFLLEVGPGNALATLARATLGRNRGDYIASSLAHPRRQDRDSRAFLEAIGRLWVSGVAVAWPELPAGSAPRRIPLPTYPFERQRYTVEMPPSDAPQVPAPDASLRADTALRMYAPIWMRDGSTPGTAPRLKGTWIVFADAGPLAKAVVQQIRAAGAIPVFAEAGDYYEQCGNAHFRVRPHEPDDISALIRDAGGSLSPIKGAILLWNLTSGDAAGTASPTRGYAALVALAGALTVLDESAPVRVLTVSAGAESVLGEPVSTPEAALHFGPVLVLPTEVPGMRIRNIDLEVIGETINVAAAAGTLIEEAALGDREIFAARRRDRRWVKRFQRVVPRGADEAALPIKRGGSYLITGGLGAIGLALAEWFATTASARLLLTGRRPLPPRGQWDALLTQPNADGRKLAIIKSIRKIEAGGGEVITAAANSADLVAMKAAIDEARSRWGDLDGVIHAAGIAGDGNIAVRQDDQEVRAVLSPKIDGLDVLVQLLGDTPLAFVALMSSINSVIGAPGASCYSAANAVLDAFVTSETRPAAWKQVFSINWGAWGEIGMAANLVVPEAMRSQHEAFLRTSIRTEAGVDAFARILGSGHERVVVTAFDLMAALEEVREPAGGAETKAGKHPAAATMTRIDQSPAIDPPTTDVERRLASIWSELTGIKNIGVYDDFFNLGGNSLLATRVIARVSDTLGTRLTLRDIFDAPTIHRLGKRISAAAPRGDATDEREEIVF